MFTVLPESVGSLPFILDFGPAAVQDSHHLSRIPRTAQSSHVADFVEVTRNLAKGLAVVAKQSHSRQNVPSEPKRAEGQDSERVHARMVHLHPALRR
jgi:hypothetical protein